MLTVLARSRRLSGFALLEAIVGIAMLAIMAAAILPLIAGAEDRARAEAAVRELDRIKSAIDKFKDRLGEYPRQLAHTSEPIRTVGDANSCGTVYSSSDSTNWTNDDAKYGPWFRDHMIFKGFGFPTAVGFVRDSLTRSSDTLIVSITDVAESQAQELDLIIDSLPAGAGANLGEIKWGAVVDGVTTVRYTLLRSGC